jgi:hypothetical protein
MKSTLTSILASLAITLTAAASPSLRIDMTIATRGDSIASRPSFYLESGKRGVISSGQIDPNGKKVSELTYAVTPTLLDNGTVDMQMVVTQRLGKNTDRHAPRIVVQLGKLAKFRVGKLVVTAIPTLLK